jgi:serine/threonine protein kinase
MEGLIGKTLDKTYRVEEVLGTGGMGAVLRAQDVNLNRDVAIKVMHAHFTGDEGFRARFLQEARAVAALDHPGIVEVHAFGQDLGLLYIVMDFVPGQTLGAWLDRLAQEQKIVALTESLRIVRRIAWALHYAHEKGVLHRDIKPSNIMLKPTDPAMREAGDLPFHPVLTDFGLAKLKEGGVETQTGTTMGTPAYMSPEQCLGYEPDRRSDVYSLGVLLFELVTGRVPFQARSLTEAIRMHTQDPPPPPRSINPALPVEIENVVLRTLAKRKEDRYATARELADALEDAISRIPKDLSVAPVRAASGQPGPYVSLMTRLSAESIPPRAPGSEVWEAAPESSGVGATLIVVAPDGKTERISLGERRTLTVGRTSDNDLQLVDKGVSRQHARIEYDGTTFAVADLNSTNGTFLGESRLLPGVSQSWPSGTMLRLGAHWLKYEVQAAVLSSMEGLLVPPSPGGRPSVVFEPDRLEVEAGQQGVARLRIMNQGTQVDHYSGVVEGIPASWITLPHDALRLNPNEEGLVTLTFHPPRNAQSTAGAHPLAITVVPQAHPEHKVQVGGSLRIPPFHEFEAELRPQQISTRKSRLEVENRGNTQVSLAISGTDPAEALFIQATPPQINLGPGEQRTIPLETKSSARRPLFGAAQRYPFEVIVASTVGQALKRAGTRIVRPLIPLWVLPLMGVLCVLLLIGAGLGYKYYTDQVLATATAETATVVAAVTLTAEADNDGDGITDLEEIRAGTDPLKADTDADGLDDKEEQSYKTDPLLADTDADGLLDGDEISEGANPLAKDSDGDTWLDGKEVHETNTSPINPDTDGDGANDNVDPDPGKLPTPTITPNATATANAVAAKTATAQAIMDATATKMASDAAGTATAMADAAAATATAMADAAAATATKMAIDAAATTGAINAAMTAQAVQDKQTTDALIAQMTAQAANDQKTKQALGATLTAEAQKPVPTSTPAYVPFVVAGNLNSAMQWDRGGSTNNKNGFYTGRMYITSVGQMNQWGQTTSAPVVRHKVSGNFDAQVLLDFNSKSGVFAGMGVQRVNSEKWWLRAGRTGNALVVDIGLGGSSSKVKTISFTANQVYLKIAKRGDWFYFYYGSDGKVWSYLHSYKMTESSPVYVYFTVFSWISSSTSGWFSDYRIAAR